MTNPEALVVFHDHGNHWAARWLQLGFRHVFVCVHEESNGHWIRIDAMDGIPAIDMIAPAWYDLASFYQSEGFTVVKTYRGRKPLRSLFFCSNCVGIVKAVLGIGAPMVCTPWQLFKYLTAGSLLPGKSVFDPPKPKPISIETIPPTIETPSVNDAGINQRTAELRRRGRRASVITGTQGLDDTLGQIARPAASSVNQLGSVGSA